MFLRHTLPENYAGGQLFIFSFLKKSSLLKTMCSSNFQKFLNFSMRSTKPQVKRQHMMAKLN